MKGRKWQWLVILAIVATYTVVSGLTIGCPFRFFLGVSCPGCGMSRSLLALLHGDIHSAFFYHPLFFLVPVLFYSIYRCEEKNDWIGKALLTLVIILFFAVWFGRLIQGHPIVLPNLEKSFLYRLKNTIQICRMIV